MKNVGKFFVSGMMLSAVSLVLRAVGVVFNAKITSYIGAEGTGLFSLISSVCTPAMMLGSAGINLAVSRIIAEEEGKGNGGAAGKVMRKCIRYSIVVSCFVTLVLYLISGTAATVWLESPDAEKLIKILALGLPVTAVSAAVSGYFVAVRRVSRNAVLQLCEQLLRVMITLAALDKAAVYGNIACLSAVIICSVISDAISCFASLIICRFDIRKNLDISSSSPEHLLGRILSITLPVSVSSFLRSGLVTIEHILIPKGLKKRGSSFSSAMASYGTLTGMAMPIVLFPSSFLYSFTGLLIPEFAESKQRNNQREIRQTADKTLRTVLIFSIGAAGILLGFSSELGMAIYKSEEAAKYIAVMSPLIPVMYLDTAVDSILKGLGEQLWTMKINIADALLSVFAVWFLVPRMGLNGYILLIFVSEIFNFSFSLYRLTSVTGAGSEIIKTALRPLIAVFGAVSSVKLLIYFGNIVFSSDGIDAAVGISLCSIIYFILLIVLGVISTQKLSSLVSSFFCSLKNDLKLKSKT